MLEVQGLNDSTALLVIEEAIPKSSESIKYGLILDFAKMKLEMCETITKKGMLNSFEDSHFWSPLEMSNELDIIDEQRIQANNPVVPATGQTTNPSPAKKKGGKWKTTVGAPGDEEQVDDAAKGKKKAKANPPLTIHRAVNMTDVEVDKLSPADIKAMNKLYKDTFTPLYKWGKKPFTDASGKPI